ncbi:hypothetical protein [Pseudoalteromonas phenolica]|uniref:hypothetical protein n=1 Tax=Pseudoalteromonas phenolica TaxID=161398 RepID=UPI0023EA64F2|nr:hypothetical protein [Pseudoalteromonas phenolica]
MKTSILSRLILGWAILSTNAMANAETNPTDGKAVILPAKFLLQHMMRILNILNLTVVKHIRVK